jgi:hypothetical protein
MDYTEKNIVTHVCRDIFRHRPGSKIFPNIFIDGFEADIFEVSRAGIMTEFEVKISRSDFFADAKKVDKHTDLKCGRRVNYFYYMMPKGLVDKSDIPEHAGLVYVELIDIPLLGGEIKTITRYDYQKVAPRLTKRKISTDQMMKYLTSMYYRFYQNYK